MSVNTQKVVNEKASMIWEVATKLVGLFKPHEYGKVILPMTILKRLNDVLKPTKKEVLDKYYGEYKSFGANRDELIKEITGFQFYNISNYDFENLLSDSENIESNFKNFINGFSDNVIDIMKNFEFDNIIAKLAENDKLYAVIEEMNTKKADMSLDSITSVEMGYIFEELIRKFSESYDEKAGAHFTSRDIIYLMTDLLINNDSKLLSEEGVSKTVYDMTMGTSQMLACMDERIHDYNKEASVICFGQELNPETYAIAKADMLIKGGDIDNLVQGDTLSKDKFKDYTFDYIISNPPFGIDWKAEKKAVEDEYALGYNGRFGPGLPAIGDGQLLFMLNGIKKLKDNGRMAIIQNGSALFNGDAESGPSEIRKYIIENDLLEAIVQLPMDLFYNTGIATYIWLISKDKPDFRKGKVQLIDASKCFEKRKKGIGKKKNDLNERAIKLIVKAYNDFKEGEIADEDYYVETQIYDNIHFGYSKITICEPVLDSEGKPELKKGNMVAKKGDNDLALVPLDESIEAYLDAYIRPYKKYAFVDTNKTKIGYEIPFTRYFYKFTAEKSASEIYKEIKEIQRDESKLFIELFGDLDDEK